MDTRKDFFTADNISDGDEEDSFGPHLSPGKTYEVQTKESYALIKGKF